MDDDNPICAEEPTNKYSLEKIQAFQAWRRKIKPLLQLLDKSPSTKLEIEICADENQESDLLNDSDLGVKCQALHDELLVAVNQKKTEGNKLWNDVQELWKELEAKEEFQLTFTYADSGVVRSLQGFKSQLLLRKTERKQRIAAFIGELRKEIADIWNQCMITQEEKDEFIEYYSEEYTEEILDIHKEELTRWQIYHKKNQEILTKIKKREEMWSNLKALEAKAEDPNRFVNRGGALLKDQNMHNSITKNLPKLEDELVKLAEKFEKEHGRKIKILGKEIPAIIDEEWKSFKAMKAAKKHARVNQSTIPTPSNNGVPLRTTRRSIMPPQLHSGMKPGEKRPAPKFHGQATPLTKIGKFTSTESMKSDEN